MSILLRRIAAAAVLLALVLCLPQGSLMLCASEDGHLALEAVCDPGSEVAHAEEHGTETAGHCECTGECGPCQDSQVGTELSVSRIRDDSGPASDLVVAPAILASAFPVALARAPDAPRRPAPGTPPDPFARIQAGACLRI